ncbi:hypothetical protein DSL72_007026 [Monilinia vaccinii-corymbosi]|uniref:Uncharacterized protein n=1 Tax=Monilinia vaccinii-corymbosi TaxID=61207 RepID=A0A8A3PLT6_9HELO|nr:hypothetical protein DSL72_007026 [Monilinia vaccinii-corymbosi]
MEGRNVFTSDYVREEFSPYSRSHRAMMMLTAGNRHAIIPLASWALYDKTHCGVCKSTAPDYQVEEWKHKHLVSSYSCRKAYYEDNVPYERRKAAAARPDPVYSPVDDSPNAPQTQGQQTQTYSQSPDLHSSSQPTPSTYAAPPANTYPPEHTPQTQAYHHQYHSHQNPHQQVPYRAPQTHRYLHPYNSHQNLHQQIPYHAPQTQGYHHQYNSQQHLHQQFPYHAPQTQGYPHQYHSEHTNYQLAPYHAEAQQTAYYQHFEPLEPAWHDPELAHLLLPAPKYSSDAVYQDSHDNSSYTAGNDGPIHGQNRY